MDTPKGPQGPDETSQAELDAARIAYERIDNEKSAFDRLAQILANARRIAANKGNIDQGFKDLDTAIYDALENEEERLREEVARIHANLSELQEDVRMRVLLSGLKDVEPAMDSLLAGPDEGDPKKLFARAYVGLEKAVDAIAKNPKSLGHPFCCISDEIEGYRTIDNVGANDSIQRLYSKQRLDIKGHEMPFDMETEPELAKDYLSRRMRLVGKILSFREGPSSESNDLHVLAKLLMSTIPTSNHQLTPAILQQIEAACRSSYVPPQSRSERPN